MRTTIADSGLIGHSWVVSFARAGHEVRLWDRDPKVPLAALEFAISILAGLAASSLLDGQESVEALAQLQPLDETHADTEHAQKSTEEIVESKRAVFADLDRVALSHAVIASSTSAILPSCFMKHVAGRARCLVCYPINSPYFVSDVKVCPSPWTAPETVKKTSAFMGGCGQQPLVMQLEIDGLIMNWMQGALLDIADVEGVEIGIREGLALCWSFIGPFETINLNAPGGMRDYAQRQIWRDRRLMALATHKRAAARDIGE